MGGVGFQLGQIANEEGDSNCSCVKSTDEGEFQNSRVATVTSTPSGRLDLVVLREVFQDFSHRLVTSKCDPYEIELRDSVPVRSLPYRC
jgi:hypothetical protein